MFQAYLRDDAPGGEVYAVHNDYDAAACEQWALDQLLTMISTNATPVTIEADGPWSDGRTDGEPWGGEFTLTSASWGDETHRLVMRADD